MPKFRVVADFQYTQVVQSVYEIEAADAEEATKIAEEILSGDDIESAASAWSNRNQWQDVSGSFEIFNDEVDDGETAIAEGEFTNE